MDEVSIRKQATFTTFEPFLCELVAADVEVPGKLGDLTEILRFVDPKPVRGVGDLIDQAIPRDRESGVVIINDW